MAKRPPQPSPAGAPQQVLDAVFPAEVRIGALALQPVSLLHYMALERIKSPLLQLGSTVQVRDVAAAVLVLSVPAKTLQSLFAGGDEGFHRRVDEFAMRVPAADILAAPSRLLSHLNAAFATAIPAGSSGGREDDPLPDSRPAADSAGASNSSNA
jgi:hypothetical protein